MSERAELERRVRDLVTKWKADIFKYGCTIHLGVDKLEALLSPTQPAPPTNLSESSLTEAGMDPSGRLQTSNLTEAGSTPASRSKVSGEAQPAHNEDCVCSDCITRIPAKINWKAIAEDRGKEIGLLKSQLRVKDRMAEVAGEAQPVADAPSELSREEVNIIAANTFSDRELNMLGNLEESQPQSWAVETMQLINKLTPDIKGKAFDPDWFLLRQRLEQIELRAGASQPPAVAADGLRSLCDLEAAKIMEWARGMPFDTTSITRLGGVIFDFVLAARVPRAEPMIPEHKLLMRFAAPPAGEGSQK